MELEIKVISTETIKPSSPTPKSLQKHILSFLDQSMPPFFIPVVYLYGATSSFPKSQKSNHLKGSLSEALSMFYPLAGRLVGNLHVDCNDAGVPFSEAEASCDLSQLLGNRDPKTTNRFLPDKNEVGRDLCMAVRATHLRGGGLAVGLLMSHKIADAMSVFIFFNAWSAVSRGAAAAVTPPDFGAGAALFRPVDISTFPYTTGLAKEEEIAARYFTFPATKIAALQERYSAVGGRRPSRVEALSTFIWTQFVSATSATGKAHAVKHAVNIRSRTNPPLPENSFGNIVGASTATPDGGDGGVELLRKVREAVKAVDGARMKDGERFVKEVMMAQATRRDVVRFDFSSLCGFPVYGADFGWGRPEWVGLAEFPYKNSVYFMDTGSGRGIEALVHLKKGDMDKLELLLEVEIHL